MKSSALSNEGSRLKAHLLTELSTIPLHSWRFFFPFSIAVWRFIQELRPGVLDELRAELRDYPYFEGKGAVWFAETLHDDDDYLTLLEKLFYPVVDAIPDQAWQRGFAHQQEIAALDNGLIDDLASVVLSSVDAAVADGTME